MAQQKGKRKAKSKQQQRRELGIFGAAVVAGTVTTSTKKGRGNVRWRSTALIVALVVLICGSLYYFDVTPFDFELIDGFKYYTYDVGVAPQGHDIVDGELNIHFIDVGQGDCIFIQFPDGKTMLIDGGERRAALSQGIPNYLLSLYPDSDRVTIDYCMLTHTDSDHCGSLDDVIAHDQIDVKCVYQPRVLSSFSSDPLGALINEQPSLYTNLPTIDTGVYASFVEAVYNEQQEGICEQIIYNFEGLSIMGTGWAIYMYNPSEQLYADLATGGQTAFEKNNVSPIMVLTFASRTVLLTGDADQKAEENFADNLSFQFEDGFLWDGDCDVLKVAHHGGADSTLTPFLDIVQPEYAVISVGEDNKHNHPREVTLDRIAEHTDNTYLTSVMGTILLSVSNTGEITWQFGEQP